jgi:hypothetical protein
MKPSIFSNYRLPLLFFLLSACSTTRINISVLQPAEISIPSNIQKISLFPGAGIPNKPGIFDSIEKVKLKPEYDYNRVKRGYMEGVYEIIQRSPRFRKVVLTDTCFEKLTSGGVISWDDLREICIHDSTDAVLLLKRAVTHDILNNINGECCGLRYNLISHTKWCFYQPFLFNTSDDFIFTDFNNYEQWISSDHIVPLQNIPGILYDACVLTGNKLGERICPHWKDDVPRIIYAGPGKSLKQAYFLASHSQWNQAAVIWNNLAIGRDKKKACHASFNMALTWEKDDDLDQAWQWAQYADTLHSTSKTKTYIKILEQRIRFKAELDNQMSGN